MEGLNGICGFEMISQPNKTVVSFIGSNQTFSWNFKLTEEEKSKKVEVVFASWNKKYDYITGDHWVTYVRESNGSESVVKDKEALIARRLKWVGDLARGFVAYQLLNVQQQDTSDYGIRFRVSGSSRSVEDGFTLSAQVPTPPPTKSPDKPRILKRRKQVTLELTGGNSTTLECTADPFPIFTWHTNSTTLECTADPFPIFTWHTKGGDIKQGFSTTSNSSYLAVTPINDSDVKNYMYKCVATNRLGFDSVTFTLIEKGITKVTGSHDKPEPVSSKDVSAENGEKQSLGLQVIRNEPVLYGACNLPSTGDPEWEIPRARLNVEKVIGHGAFGVVSRGLALDLPGKPGWTDASGKEKKDLLSEMSFLKHLDPHPHVIRLYGCVTTEARRLVVVEYAQYGDLLEYLRKSRGVRDNYYSNPSFKPRTDLTSKQLLRFAWQISDGMDYLSKKKDRSDMNIIDRDLAARNVLVGDEDDCKITDFGMARDVWEEDIYVRTHEGRLPIKWTAPEALFGSGAYTTQSDVSGIYFSKQEPFNF
ncbi:fibroblast growth factor receptor 3-like [Stylophora pistillata]|uniref:fibroblast growth factor receptor 3-like n=1 Tax=Stylophora pistillata TaxID=50429 RepID=UPI000C04AA98|nr:fibroblast growth factor receptor 3-like [Stylophora pistillata]